MNCFVKNIFKRKNYILRAFSSQVNVKTNTDKWDICAAVSLERLPIITRDYNEIEVKFLKLLEQIELEKSYKSNFEIKLEKELKKAKDIKEGKLSDLEIDNLPQQTGQDFLDATQEELKSFKFASRKNEKIDTNLKSNKRALDRRLLLLIQEKLGEKEYWILPHGKYNGEKSLRQTAERVLEEKCGSNLKVKFLGNCPYGYYFYKYPKNFEKDTVGAKVFFFKAQLENGQVDEKICNNFQWAMRSELKILPEKYYKAVKKFLIEEEH